MLPEPPGRSEAQTPALGSMNIQATVVFDFNAADVGEAGKRLNEMLDHAAEHELKHRSLDLSALAGTPVTLPPVALEP